MVSRTIDINSIQNVREFVTKKETIETLKKINDNLIIEEEQNKSNKKQSKSNTVVDPNLVGWTNGEEIFGKEPTQKNKKQSKDEAEFDKIQSQVNDLKSANLIVEGQHTPLIEKQKAGEPDTYDQPIRKFRVTEAGSALLELAEQLGIIRNLKKNKDSADEVQDNNPEAASEDNNIRTKEAQKREDKESEVAVRKTIANSKSKAT